MKIVVASGKGGTGKTSVAVNLALSVGAKQILDCDVEEPNVHIFLGGTEKEFIPRPEGTLEPVQLGPAELEVLRLIDLLNLSQERAGEKMGTSRGTIWRLLQSARRKVTSALIEGRKIKIE